MLEDQNCHSDVQRTCLRNVRLCLVLSLRRFLYPFVTGRWLRRKKKQVIFFSWRLNLTVCAQAAFLEVTGLCLSRWHRAAQFMRLSSFTWEEIVFVTSNLLFFSHLLIEFEAVLKTFYLSEVIFFSDKALKFWCFLIWSITCLFFSVAEVYFFLST